jgi:hypothetical protein
VSNSQKALNSSHCTVANRFGLGDFLQHGFLDQTNKPTLGLRFRNVQQARYFCVRTSICKFSPQNLSDLVYQINFWWRFGVNYW